MPSYTATASAATSTVILAAGGERDVVIIENSDANRMHVYLAGAAAVAATAKSFSLAQNENAMIPQYAGEIRAIWDADGSGYAHVTTY